METIIKKRVSASKRSGMTMLAILFIVNLVCINVSSVIQLENSTIDNFENFENFESIHYL